MELPNFCKWLASTKDGGNQKEYHSRIVKTAIISAKRTKSFDLQNQVSLENSQMVATKTESEHNQSQNIIT